MRRTRTDRYETIGKVSITRRSACGLLLGLPLLNRAALGQTNPNPRPEGFKVYSDAPRLLLSRARVKLLRRERERRSLRWDQFETLWTGGAEFQEPGFASALHYQISEEAGSAKKAIAWALGAAGTDIRQVALVADWCTPVLSATETTRLTAKLKRAAENAKTTTLTEARDRAFAAIVLSETDADLAARVLQDIFDKFWMTSFLPPVRDGKVHISNADGYPLLELFHAFRDNLNFDLRDTFPTFFRQFPLTHLMAHYPAPFPASQNEFRIPAEPNILQKEPDLRKAVLSRAAELAMVAFDANSAETQVLQGWLTNDRFLMRGTVGIPYELLWANPYQPGLSYYHIPLALHDEVGGQLFVRSSWEDNAAWIGYFEGNLQLFQNGGVTMLDPQLNRDPLDIEEATVFFASNARKFTVPSRNAEDKTDDVFVVGLKAKTRYHVEVDDQEMFEDTADPGGILFLPTLRTGVGVRFNPVPDGV